MNIEMTIEVQTFGCRLNAYESEVIRSHATEAGLENVLIFNTCAVTKEAERQARQAIRRAKRENPEAHIIVTGCSAQVHPDQYGAMKEVDVVLGNEEKLKAGSYVSIVRAPHPNPLPEERGRASDAAVAKNEALSLGRGVGEEQAYPHAKVMVNDIMSITETASHLVTAFDGHTRAFVQVQNGCNHRCTFCIIPYGRGNSRSVPVGEIVSQVRTLVERGFKEVVLTGVDISAYGEDLPGQPSLGQLCRRLLKLVPDLPRLRLSSIDAVEVDDDLYHLLAEEPRLMPHLHISLQAGDDLILKRMKRRHLRQDAIDFCTKVRQLRPDVVFGADIIAGFPTETEEMFRRSLDLVEEAGLTYLHVFPYSEREGTPAARMPQVPHNIRKERASRLRELGQRQEAALLKSCVGKQYSVLMEQDGIGRTEHFLPVSCFGAQSGELITIATQAIVEDKLIGMRQ